MKFFRPTLLTLSILAASAWASAITVTTPANGAQVTSPFKLVASTTTCSAKPAVSMGYSVDSGSTVIEPTSFSAMVTATAGKHVLHVKCWGKQVNGNVNLNITIVPPSTTTTPPPAGSAITVTSPLAGATVSSPFTLTATAQVCSSQAVVSMGYSIDSSSSTTVVKAQSIEAAVVAATGAHILHVKSWGGSGTSCVSNVSINVVSSTVAPPTFSLAAGTYASAESVKLSDITTSATIYYTTNGSTPSTSSTKYTGAIAVNESEVIKAFAVVPGYLNSAMVTSSYIIAPVSTPPPSTGPVPPANAIASTDLQLRDTWNFEHDDGTPGTAVGTTSLVTSPSLSGNSRKFSQSYTGSGGVRYSISYASDTTSKNFLYDNWVWIQDGSSISNLEMDSNQVTANGRTIIYAFQCSGYTNTWEYSGAGAKWVSSSQSCNPSKWETNVWHHVQISYSRDDSGYVTYHSVWWDGDEQVIEETVPSTFALGWKVGVVNTQFQIDGIGNSGSSVVYADKMTIYRW